MAQNIEGGVNNPVDNEGKTSGKLGQTSKKATMVHILGSALAAAGLAIVHGFFTELDGCAELTAKPETAGLLGAGIRGIIIAMRSGLT